MNVTAAEHQLIERQWACGHRTKAVTWPGRTGSLNFGDQLRELQGRPVGQLANLVRPLADAGGTLLSVGAA